MKKKSERAVRSLPLLGIPCEGAQRRRRKGRKSQVCVVSERFLPAVVQYREAHVLHDDIESRYSVRCDEKQRFRVVGNFVDVAHLASSEECEGGAISVEQCGGHCR